VGLAVRIMLKARRVVEYDGIWQLWWRLRRGCQ